MSNRKFEMIWSVAQIVFYILLVLGMMGMFIPGVKEWAFWAFDLLAK